MGFMADALNKWVLEKLRQSGWSMRELGRRGGLSSAYISDVLSGKQNPGAKFYLGLSKAFDMPISSIELLDTEGVIPDDDGDLDLSFSEWKAIFEQLDRGQRVEALKYMVGLLLGKYGEETDDAPDEAGSTTVSTQ